MEGRQGRKTPQESTCLPVTRIWGLERKKPTLVSPTPLLQGYCWRFRGNTPHLNDKSSISAISGASNNGSKTLLNRCREVSDLPFASSILQGEGAIVLPFPSREYLKFLHLNDSMYPNQA
ncbi:hypothetical protein [Dulcicalothrix desertica]|uniref:hypothetical protein n=1 Tax=Dulcicalothrix desertica TaxID=32056 RepID=UPI000F8F6AC6|nr:hypothetical protein [Dulcicalothrix desertica]TWH55694.1 hypothetical protein CAL7102_03856 [Dulcicalothrix desertica PCC 7102]